MLNLMILVTNATKPAYNFSYDNPTLPLNFNFKK